MSLWFGLAWNMASVSFLTIMTLLFFPFFYTKSKGIHHYQTTTTQAEKVSFEWGPSFFGSRKPREVLESAAERAITIIASLVSPLLRNSIFFSSFQKTCSEQTLPPPPFIQRREREKLSGEFQSWVWCLRRRRRQRRRGKGQSADRPFGQSVSPSSVVPIWHLAFRASDLK